MAQLTTPTIRSYLTIAYNDEELTTLCADHFPAVYTDFTVGMTKTQKIQLLLNHCQRRERFPDLLTALERDRPDPYQRFLAALPQQAPADPDEPADEERQERADVEAEITAIRAAVQSQAQAAGRNQQAVLDALQCIADRVAHVDARIAALEKAGQPAQAARWRALLTRFGELVLLLVGSAALRDIFAQSELDAAVRDRLTTLLARAGPSQAAAAPLPSSTPPPKPQPKAEPPRPPAGPLNFDWVLIPVGPFRMGSDPRADPHAEINEQPQHTVHLSAFWISRTPVTNRQWVAFIRATSYTTDAARNGYDHTWYQPRGPSQPPLTMAEANHPVIYISWHDARAFCRWAGVRLPTEAEWEKTARGPDGRLYPWGNDPPDARRCNFNQQVGHTTPVDRYPAGASPYGVLDMAGNVWEWCSD